MRGTVAAMITMLALAGRLNGQEEVRPVVAVSAYDVVYTSRSSSSAGSMPLGNGDIGINVWVEPGGRIQCYVSKTDAWDAKGNLLKLGRLSLGVGGDALLPGKKFSQRLDLETGRIVVQCGEGADETTIRFWVDANLPVVRIEIESEKEIPSRLSYHVWRTADEHILDEVADTAAIFFHRNSSSIYPGDARKLNIAADAEEREDPLLNRTFGGLMTGTNVVRRHKSEICTQKPAKTHCYELVALTAITGSPDEYVEKLQAEAVRVVGGDRAHAFKEHCAWWRNFWARSWINVTGGDREKAFRVSQAYNLQRFMLACAGRGAYPIKFNGSIFTVDMREEIQNQQNVDADYRRWGGQYWFQNTRWMYWPMLASGDFEMLKPFFGMYGDLRTFEKVTHARFQVAGAIFDETIPFWGMAGVEKDGIDRKKQGYKARHWNGNFELLAMLLDYRDYTGDEKIAERICTQLDGVLTFYSKFYDVEGKGALVMDPSQALETYWDTVNPTPDVAGLHEVLERVLGFPSDALDAGRKERYEKFLALLPSLAVVEENGKRYVNYAELVRDKGANSENPELYCIFPFRRLGVGRADVELGRETFNRRRFRNAHCWRSDDVQAACLGMGKVAWDLLWQRLGWGGTNSQCRFPAYWGPTNDWVPDQDHGGAGMTALQNMLVQPGPDGSVLVFPAWQAGYDVEFKLHAPGGRTVFGKTKDGKIVEVRVTPEMPEGKLRVLDLQ